MSTNSAEIRSDNLRAAHLVFPGSSARSALSIRRSDADVKRSRGRVTHGSLGIVAPLVHHFGMIEFRTLPDDHPDLMRSPLLRGALMTLQYAKEHGSIGLTQTKAFS